MGGFMRGKFQATDDLDLAFNRIRNWRTIDDLPVGDGEDGQVLAIVSGAAQWTTIETGGGGAVSWDDITDKPASFTPSTHTHTESEITDLQSYALDSHTHVPGDITGLDTGVTTLTAGAGINLSSSTDAVTITNSGVLSIVAGTNVSVNTSVGTVTISASGGAGGGVTSITAGAGISVTTSTGDVTISSAGSNELGWYDVTATTYGAVGDGTTDDTTAVQDAIDAATAGGVVYFPPGTYKLSSVNITASHSHITIRGAGRGETVVTQNSTSTSSLFNVATTKDVLFQDMRVEGSSNANGQGNHIVRFYQVEKPRIENCHVYKVGSTTNSRPLIFISCDGGGIENCWVDHDSTTRSHLQFGILFATTDSNSNLSCFGGQASNNHISDAVYAINNGFRCNYMQITGNYAHNCTQTVRDVGGNTNLISANYPV